MAGFDRNQVADISRNARPTSAEYAATIGPQAWDMAARSELGLVVSINSGHYSDPNSRLQWVIPPALFSRLIMPAVKD
jgi:hypothetical protein